MAEQKFTPRAENVLRLAQETALELGHGYVGCEHILLGLLREDGSAACRALGRGRRDGGASCVSSWCGRWVTVCPAACPHRG